MGVRMSTVGTMAALLAGMSMAIAVPTTESAKQSKPRTRKLESPLLGKMKGRCTGPGQGIRGFKKRNRE